MAIIVAVLAIVSGVGFIVYDAMFSAGDIVMKVVCKNDENLKQGWQEMNDSFCNTYNGTASLIKSVVNPN